MHKKWREWIQKNILHRCSGKEINRKRHKNNYKESKQWPMRAEEEGVGGGGQSQQPMTTLEDKGGHIQTAHTGAYRE